MAWTKDPEDGMYCRRHVTSNETEWTMRVMRVCLVFTCDEGHRWIQGFGDNMSVPLEQRDTFEYLRIGDG